MNEAPSHQRRTLLLIYHRFHRPATSCWTNSPSECASGTTLSYYHTRFYLSACKNSPGMLSGVDVSDDVTAVGSFLSRTKQACHWGVTWQEVSVSWSWSHQELDGTGDGLFETAGAQWNESILQDEQRSADSHETCSDSEFISCFHVRQRLFHRTLCFSELF